MLLVAHNLYKNFRVAGASAKTATDATCVLRGASLQVAAGEMVAVVGASGAGKTTLLHVLGGLEKVDAGSVRLDDFEVATAHGDELARYRSERVGFVFQSHRLLASLRVWENVALPLLIKRMDVRAARERAREMLVHVGLAEHAEKQLAELSGGEQQRAAVARALVGQPRLILADEPTGNLDRQNAAQVGELLNDLCRGSQLAVLIATHNAELAARCDRVLHLRDGRIALTAEHV